MEINALISSVLNPVVAAQKQSEIIEDVKDNEQILRPREGEPV